MATAVEASNVAMRYVTEAERCPSHPPKKYCLWLLNIYPHEGKKNAWSFDFIVLWAFIAIVQHWWL
jgi:hypothetical protein